MDQRINTNEVETVTNHFAFSSVRKDIQNSNRQQFEQVHNPHLLIRVIPLDSYDISLPNDEIHI